MAAKKWQKGKVKWFDKASGRGVISSDSGEVYDVHYSAIKSEKKTRNLRENKKIEFLPLDDPEFKIVKVVRDIAA